MSTKPDKMLSLTALRASLESLRTSVLDVEALASSAEAVMEQVPGSPRLPQVLDTARRPWNRDERRTLGRAHALVTATAQAAENALDEFSDFIRELEEMEDESDAETPDVTPAH
jgi:biopolymer transport protein ExbB/TolQ